MSGATDGKTASQRIADSMKKLNATLEKRKPSKKKVKQPYDTIYHGGRDPDPSKV